MDRALVWLSTAAVLIAAGGCGATLRQTSAAFAGGNGARFTPAPAAVGLPHPADPPGIVAAADHPLSLEEAIALALERYPDFRAAAERIAEAEAKLGEATSAFYPQVAARLGYARTDNPAQAFAMILNQRRFTFDLDFNDPGATQNVRPEIFGVLPLYRGGQDYERRQASALGVEAARLQRQAVRNALTEAVIASYYALLASPEQVQTAESSIGAVDSALSQARARFDAGTALESDILSLEVRLSEARQDHLRAENAVELSRAGMRALLALPAGVPVEIAPPLDGPPADLPETAAQAQERAAAARPEVAAAARQVEMRQREVNAEWAAFLPRLDAVGNFGNDSSNFELSSRRDSWAFSVAAEIDLFNGFRTRERVRAAESRLEETRQAERRTRLEIEREVQAAFLVWDEARKRTRVAEAAVSSADEALRLVEVQYEAGAATITRYLEAEAARTAARSRAIAARFDLRRAEAGLQKAMGVWARDEEDEG